MNRAAIVAALVLVAALVAGCSGGSSDEATASPTVTSTRRPAATATAKTVTASPTASAQLTATPTPTAPPAQTEPPPQATQPPAPQPTQPPAPAANQSPGWPGERSFEASTEFEYDDYGSLMGAVTYITLGTPCADPDGDPLSYSWTATNGSISGGGLSATWTNVIEYGNVAPGTVTVTCVDGKGGSAVWNMEFS